MTNPPALHPPPRWRDVIEEQLRAVGLAIWRPALLLGAFVAGVTLLAWVSMDSGKGLDVSPRIAPIIAMAALLSPFLVWKGEFRARRSYLAALPVHRTLHTLVKVAAGWVWLMVLTSAFVLWLLAVAKASGGAVSVKETFALARDLPQDFTAEDVLAAARVWTDPGWLWAVSFAGATATYLAGTVVALASGRTRRWMAGTVIGGGFLLLFAHEEEIAAGGMETWLPALLEGRYGIETLLTGNNDFVREFATPAGERVLVYNSLPDLEQWVLATLLWIGLSLGGLLLVLQRDRRG